MSAATSLYRHFSRDGALLYVGISLRPLRRLGEHGDSKWFDEIAKVEMERFPTRLHALTAEREAIISERPIHNVIHNRPKRRREVTVSKKASDLVGFAEVRKACGINPIYSKTFPRPINPEDESGWRWRRDEVDRWLVERQKKKKGSWKPPIEDGDAWLTSTDINDLVDLRVASVWKGIPPPSAKAINYGKGPHIMKGRDMWRLSEVVDVINRHRRTPISPPLPPT